MKRKLMNDIENNLNSKKAKHTIVYTQEIYLFSEFQKYIEGMRSCVKSIFLFGHSN
jgi:hypothetical protein